MSGRDRNLSLLFKKSIYLLILFLPVFQFSQQEPVLFKFSRISGALSFLYEYTSEEERIYDGLFRDIDRQYLEGGVLLNTTGSIYHPNFLSFRADINVAGHRSKNVLFSDASINNAVNNTYNINLTFFKKKKINFQFFALRNFSTFDRAFYERYFTTYKSFGTVLTSKAKLFPFQLDVYTIRVKSESLSFFERDEKTKNLDFKVELFTKARTRSSVTFKGKDYSEAVYDIDYRSMDLMANFQHVYGNERQSNTFLSVFTFHKMSGEHSFENASLHNSLIHYLKRNLYLYGIYTMLRDNSYSRSYTRHDVSGSLVHELFDSLTSRFLLGGRFENSNFQDINAYRYQLTFNYRKKIPKGSFQLFYSGRKEKGKYRSKSDLTDTSELYDFSLADSFILAQQGINIDSIRVTDPEFLFFYVKGVDYEINVLNNVISITRLPGGAIPVEGSVLVHFEYLSYPDFDLKARYSQFSAQVNLFKYFRFFYRNFVNRQNIISDYWIPPFEDYAKKVLGAQFIAPFLRAEYHREHYNSSLSEYISNNYRVSANVNIAKFFKLSGDVTVNRLKYIPDLYFSHLDAYSLEGSFFPLRNLTLNAAFRDITYSTTGYSRERQSVIVKLHWAVRRIIVDFFYEHIFTGYEAIARAHDYVSLVIRRTF